MRMKGQLAEIVRDSVALVRIDSQNPGPCETECARWLVARLQGAGVRTEEMATRFVGRPNVMGTVEGRQERPRLVLLAHMDTVPIGEGWSVDPLGGEIADGRIYGRGAADMKGGLAVGINVLSKLAAARERPPCTVVFCGTVDEEGPGMTGAHALASSGRLRHDDQILALEPTGLRLRRAHVGVLWIEVRVVGRMAHAGRAHLGIDANEVMARFVNEIKAKTATLEATDHDLGRPRVTCGRIDGGVAPNVVPGVCLATFDFRITPPLTLDGVDQLVSEVARRMEYEFLGAEISWSVLGVSRPPVRASDSSKLISSLRGAYKACANASLESGGADGHEAYTDAAMIATLTGSDSCAAFGPGSSDRAHTPDEYVEIDQLDQAANILHEVIARW